MKTYLTNPELLKEETPCEVLMPSQWIGAKTNKSNVWIPAKITKVEYSEGYPVAHVCLYESEKYHNSTLDNMIILRSQLYTTLRFTE